MASTAVIEAIRRTQDDCPSEPADKHLLETNNPTELRGVPGSLGNPGIQGQARGTVAPDPPPEPGFFGANATARAFQCCCPRAAGNGVGERSARSHVYGCKLPTGLPLKLFADHATGIPIPELAPVTDSRIRLEIPSRSKGGRHASCGTSCSTTQGWGTTTKRRAVRRQSVFGPGGGGTARQYV